jgi:tetratricopeptide (TPR) repeat protein
LIEAVAGPGTLSREVVDQIAERTDGVPLFVEELAKATAEAENSLSGEKLLRKALGSASIPATLHASPMARLDRLGVTARHVAQTAAVIGREFNRELLGSIWTGAEEEIDKALGQLRTAGLVFARGAGGQATHLFKHALVQDAAYSTLLRAQKQHLHRAVAERLCLSPETGNLSELIARHYREAQAFQRAAEWRLRAGEVSNQRTAYREAVENLREGLADATLLPETNERKELELRLNIALSVPFIALDSFSSGQTAEVVARAEALSLELGKPQPAPLLCHRAVVSHLRGDYRLCIPVARQLEESMAGTPVGLRGSVLRIFAEVMSGCDLADAKKEIETCFERLLQCGPEADRLRYAYTYDFKAGPVPCLATVLWHVGYPDQAVRVCDYGRARAIEVKHSMTLCVILSWEIRIHELRGDLVKMETRIEELHAISKQDNLAAWYPFVLQWQALPAAAKGDVAAALAMLDEARGTLDGLNQKIGRTDFLGQRARMLDLAGRGDEALAAIDQALETVRSSDEKIYYSNLCRLRGDFLIRYHGQNAEPEAEEEFKEAIAFARKQNALSYELRASQSLANLMRRRGDETSALQLLEPVFDRFTEGFDTADLIAARETIDELRQQTGAARS